MTSNTRTEYNKYLLTTDNYALWKLPMAAKLEDIGAYDFIAGFVKITEKTSADEITRLTSVNQKGYSRIIQNLDPTNLALQTSAVAMTTRSNLDESAGVAKVGLGWLVGKERSGFVGKDHTRAGTCDQTIRPYRSSGSSVPAQERSAIGRPLKYKPSSTPQSWSD
ncbi:hypothetical protein PtA15_8A528 [Puccinia triticina]|uniref:DUF4219 domain-containing protein n=1 Tax=Puccinia triticina TaxID=208348 RepID=A0ABY7CQT1_9BASI|nr:uncharacterized protein PtA15_8A528 [Puccinia triticina]WAQ87623.1 hypothetical protein PtA15_8A528 [Puccinia triticina]